MKNIENYMVLTEASYTDFFGLELSADNKSKIEKAIKDEGDDNGKTKSGMAKYIADRYNVIDHCTDENHPASTDRPYSKSDFGFSATLFQDKTTKEYVFAIKGSKGTYDLAIADAGDIANDGLAHHQIVDMYNFWQSIVQDEFRPAETAADFSGCLIGDSHAA